MVITFKNVIPKEDYTLEVTMTNHNRLVVDMKPYLDTVQFCPLKDPAVWGDIKIRGTSLYWKGYSKVELSIDTILCLLKAGEKDGEEAGIRRAVANDDWRLLLQLSNGNIMDIYIEPLLEYPLFTPLLNRGLWKTMEAREYSLLWEDKSISLELPMKTIFDYFA